MALIVNIDLKWSVFVSDIWPDHYKTFFQNPRPDQTISKKFFRDQTRPDQKFWVQDQTRPFQKNFSDQRPNQTKTIFQRLDHTIDNLVWSGLFPENFFWNGLVWSETRPRAALITTNFFLDTKNQKLFLTDNTIFE
jgi:hypothetical protein